MADPDDAIRELADALAALIAVAAKSAEPRLPVTILTAGEAAELLKVSRSKVYNMLRRGELKSVKIGRARRIPMTEIQRLIDGAS